VQQLHSVQQPLQQEQQAGQDLPVLGPYLGAEGEGEGVAGGGLHPAAGGRAGQLHPPQSVMVT
jgi:hypothetical protein